MFWKIDLYLHRDQNVNILICFTLLRIGAGTQSADQDHFVVLKYWILWFAESALALGSVRIQFLGLGQAVQERFA
ncbi:hypothetical protein [Leifsonia aquatica]|uniref:hypothetical protein n=1 Tax=Leifsonia aquatica TaxID=144185 RepID=UPI0013B40973|nr:hypothetical protein [Leifsonia aquatica]